MPIATDSDESAPAEASKWTPRSHRDHTRRVGTSEHRSVKEGCIRREDRRIARGITLGPLPLEDKRRIARCWTCAIVVVFSVEAGVRGQSFQGSLRGALKDGGGLAPILGVSTFGTITIQAGFPRTTQFLFRVDF
jgi:hypothetical protein